MEKIIKSSSFYDKSQTSVFTELKKKLSCIIIMVSEQALYFIPVVLSYALPTFIFKDLTKYFNNFEIIIFYHFLYHIFILGAIILLIFYKKSNICIYI